MLVAVPLWTFPVSFAPSPLPLGAHLTSWVEVGLAPALRSSPALALGPWTLPSQLGASSPTAAGGGEAQQAGLGPTGLSPRPPGPVHSAGT